MYICVCHQVTDKDIERAVHQGACSLRDLRQQFNVGATCGRCSSCARGILSESKSVDTELKLQVA